jgi:hypothetical protein
VAITFDRDDHPDYVPNPRVYPLVVDPIIANTHLTKVLMDGDSTPLGVHMHYVIRLHFPASNNVAEYEALVMGLRITVELGVQHLDV